MTCWDINPQCQKQKKKPQTPQNTKKNKLGRTFYFCSMSFLSIATKNLVPATSTHSRDFLKAGNKYLHYLFKRKHPKEDLLHSPDPKRRLVEKYTTILSSLLVSPAWPEVPSSSWYLPGPQSQDGHPRTSGQLQVSGYAQSPPSTTGKERLWSLAKPFKAALPLPPACWLAADKENMGRSAVIRGGRDFGLSHPSKNLKTDCRLLKNLLSELVMAILHWLRLQVFVYPMVCLSAGKVVFGELAHAPRTISPLTCPEHITRRHHKAVCLRRKHKPVHRRNHC